MMKTKRFGGCSAIALALSATLAGAAGAQEPGTSQTVAYGQGTSSTVQDDLFAGTEKFSKGASEVSEITMDPDTLDMVNGRDSKRAHNMVLNVVRSYEYDKPGMYRIEDVEEFRKKLNTGDWHCSVHTRELKSGESTDICNKRRTDGMVEQAIITVEPKELTFIHTIRRGGGGSSMNLPDIGGVMSSIGPELAMIGPGMQAIRPEMEAEMKAAMAELRAHQAELGPLNTPRIDSEDLKRQLRALPEVKLPDAERKGPVQEPPAPPAPQPPQPPPAPQSPTVPVAPQP